jgi:O-antigen ligase
MTDRQNTLSTLLEKGLTGSLYLVALAMPFSIAITQIAIGIGIVVWIADSVVTGRRPFRRLGLESGFLVFFIAALISLPFSYQPLQSFIYLKRFLLIPLIYLLACSVRDPRIYQKLILLFLISITLYSVTGIYSFFQHPTVRVRHIQNSMTAGGITMIGALAALGVAFYHKRSLWRWSAAAAAGINLICLILTSTRGSWLGFLAGLVVMIFWTHRKWLLALPVLIAVIWVAQPDAFSHRVSHMFDPSWRTNAKRLKWWHTGWEIFKDHPIVGIGDVSTQPIYRQYAGPDETEMIGHFHSNYIHIAVTMGIIGLAAFLFMLAQIFYRLGQRLKTADPILSLGWPLVALAVMTAFSINGFFEWNYGDQEILTLVWFGVGLALVSLSNGSNPNAEHNHGNQI